MIICVTRAEPNFPVLAFEINNLHPKLVIICATRAAGYLGY